MSSLEHTQRLPSFSKDNFALFFKHEIEKDSGNQTAVVRDLF